MGVGLADKGEMVRQVDSDLEGEVEREPVGDRVPLLVQELCE